MGGSSVPAGLRHVGSVVGLLALGVVPAWSAEQPVVPAQPAPAAPAAPAPVPAPLPAAVPAKPANPEAAGTPAMVIDEKQIESILGKPVLSPTGEDMGRIVDVLVDKTGDVRAAVIDFGGFFGVGSRKIAVDWHSLHFKSDSKADTIVTDLPQAKLRTAPVYKDGEPVVVLGRAGAGVDSAPAPVPPVAAPAPVAPAAAPAPAAPVAPTTPPSLPSPVTPAAPAAPPAAEPVVK